MDRQSPPERTLEAYESVTESARLERLRRVGTALEGTRVCHLNSTARGGGVAELLQSIVPLSVDCGVDTDWLVMGANESFFEVTKALHNGLQGKSTPLTDEMIATYRSTIERNGDAFADIVAEHGPYDVIVLHDPQPLGLAAALADRYPDTTLVWRCHVDLTDPDPEHLGFITEMLDPVDHVIVTRKGYGSGLEIPEAAVSVIHPSIDPLTAKNRPLTAAERRTQRQELSDIDADRPLLVHVSRFDPWKDQAGTLAAYRQLREGIPSVQLVMAGAVADDDPEGRTMYEEIADEAADYPDVHLFLDYSDLAINYLQRTADVAVQKSIREGFGLVVAEALWKCTPVVGSSAGGIPLQIEDGTNGFVVDPNDIEGMADALETLLSDPELRAAFGAHGRDHVQSNFLLPRQLEDCLSVLEGVR